MIWLGVGFAVLMLAIFAALAFVKPDYDEYPDGTWPGKSWMNKHASDGKGGDR